MRKIFMGLVFLVVTALVGNAGAAADILLPPPRTEGGMGLFEALKKRSSAPGGDFSGAEIKLEELSTILWAASGLNRGRNGWTVPLAKGWPPYCRVYVAGTEGVYLYDWSAHSLKEISRENIKARIGSQGFVKKAFYILIFVADGQALAALNDGRVSAEFSRVAVGAMTQNVYLAAAALQLGARYIHAIKAEEIAGALKLADGDAPICLMLLGK